MRFRIALAALIVFSGAPQCAHAAVTLPYTFTSGGSVKASEVNANDQALRDGINNHLADRNGHSTRLQDILTTGNSCGSTSIDFNGTQALTFRVENLSADPTCGASSKGRLIWNTTDALFKICNGSSYVSIAGTGVNTLQSVLTAGNSAGSTNINLNGNQLLAARVENLASDPGAGSIGRIIFNTTSSSLKIDNGTAWVTLGGAQNLSSVLAQGNSAGAYDLDLNGHQAINMRWEQLASSPGTTTAGRVYYNTTSNKPYYYNGTSWLEVGNTNTLAQTMALGNSTGAYNLNLNLNQLQNAKMENLAAPPGTGQVGRFWIDTTTDQMQFGTSSSNRTVVSTDGTQTLTNKAISGSSNTFSNIPDSALSANVGLLNGTQTVSGTKTFSAAPVVSKIKTPAGTTLGHVIPDGLSDDTFVLANAVQTLNGKTLNAPTLSGNLDFALFQGKNMVAEKLSANPGTPTAGRVFYKTTTGELLYGNGTTWNVLTSNNTAALNLSGVLSNGNSAGGFNIDFNGNQAQNLVLDKKAVDPAAATQGRLFYNTASDEMKWDTGLSILTVAEKGAMTTALAGKEPTITASTTAKYWRGDKSWQTLDTSVVPENGNVYWTQARFDTAFTGKSTTNLSEGTNLYWTPARFDTRLATKSTTDLAEGTNLYYTNARVSANASVAAATAHIAASSGVHGVTGSVVGTTDAQTLSAKTFGDQLTLTQVATPAGNPAAGKDYVYFKSDDKLYRKDSGGTEREIGGGALLVSGSRASPTAITAAGGITSTSNQRQLMFVQGSGGAVDITASPQISAGSTVGQELILVGRSDTNTLLLEDGTGLSLNGSIYLGADMVLTLMWDGTNWLELSRRN